MTRLKATIKTFVNNEYEKLKSDSRTYGELEKKIKQYKKDAIWEQDEIKRFIGNGMYQKLKREISDKKIDETGTTINTDVFQGMKGYIIRVLKGGSDVSPQEIAILPQIIDEFCKELQSLPIEDFPEEFLNTGFGGGAPGPQYTIPCPPKHK